MRGVVDDMFITNRRTPPTLATEITTKENKKKMTIILGIEIRRMN